MNASQCQEYLQKIQALGIKLGLENIQTVLSSFDNPHEKYPSVLVAGTNGKGSVCAMLAQILAAHGFRAGLYTSPHLIKIEERIRVGNSLISSRDFCRLLTILKKGIDRLLDAKKLESHLTFFEVLTCLAFLYFEKRKVDIAVLEVGMGGRFDATNVVTPLVSVITTISKDHQEFLGKRLSQIALEKAGIIKPGVPVVCGVQRGEAYRVIKKRAQELQARFLGVFDKPGCFQAQKKGRRYHFIYQLGRDEYRYTPSLRGEHQGRNAAVAVAAACALSQIWKKLQKRKIIQGIKNTKWEGRLEIVSRKPLVLLDGTHNEGGAATLKRYIQDFISRPLILVFAMMKDKEIKKVADILFPLARKIILTRFPYSRAASPEEIKALVLKFQERVILEPELKRAVRAALRLAGSRGCVLITGSLFLVGEAKKLFPAFHEHLK